MHKNIDKFVLNNEEDLNDFLVDLIDTIFYCQNNFILVNGKKFQLEVE